MPGDIGQSWTDSDDHNQSSVLPNRCVSVVFVNVIVENLDFKTRYFYIFSILHSISSPFPASLVGSDLI